jgi:hypothetical protein
VPCLAALGIHSRFSEASGESKRRMCKTISKCFECLRFEQSLGLFFDDIVSLLINNHKKASEILGHRTANAVGRARISS